MRRVLLACGGVATFLVTVPAVADEASDHFIDDVRWQRRGIMRAGALISTAAASAACSSVALALTTEGRMIGVALAMAGSSLVVGGVGTAMWAIGSPGRRTRPTHPRMMIAGMLVSGAAMALVPISSALLAASFDEELGATRELRIAAGVTGVVANLGFAAGIPPWAIGAASPDDIKVREQQERLGLSLSLGAGSIGLSGSF